MLVSFVCNIQSRVRKEEVYRLISMDHDVSLERENPDLWIQQLSVAIVESVRAGDHAFRYSDEEFLIILVETELRKGAKLRLRVRALEFHLPNRTVRHVTLSVGVTQFEGHPDFQHLLHRMEAALARAGNEGAEHCIAVPPTTTSA
jgi:diguanylate cyclase